MLRAAANPSTFKFCGPLISRKAVKIIATWVLAAAAGAGLSGTTVVFADGHIEPSRIDAALNGFIQSKALVGVSGLVYQDGKEVYFGAFGAADRESGKPMARDTLVQIFSMTKPITGVAFMMLYEEGKFQLDDPLEKYAPEFANMRVYAGIDPHGEVLYEPVRRKVTVRDITRHTVGFYNGTDHTPLGEIVRAADPGSKTNTLSEEIKKLGSLPCCISRARAGSMVLRSMCRHFWWRGFRACPSTSIWSRKYSDP